jgi:hypothetical protein
MTKILIILAVLGLLISAGNTAFAIWFAMGVAVDYIFSSGNKKYKK